MEEYSGTIKDLIKIINDADEYFGSNAKIRIFNKNGEYIQNVNSFLEDDGALIFNGE